MRIIHQPAELQAAGRPVCAAIGVFDGVHRGHQAVIGHAVREAARTGGVAVVITFDRHPRSIVDPARAPALIQPLSRKLAALGALGAEAALVFHFDHHFSLQSAEAFVHALYAGFGTLASLSVGANFFFGHGRAGNVQVLQELGRRYGFAVQVAEPVLFGGEPISSTRVRAAIRAGQLAEVTAMLGRPYAVCGPVLRGQGLGRQLGFPTANVAVEGLEMPPQGVYAARVILPDGPHPAVVNWGRRPTVAGGAAGPHFEVHLPGWQGDLYGQELEVQLGRYLRAEQRFPAVEALRAQIARDVAAALAAGGMD
ncbi:riboflavin biosynthesis protein RibF [Fontisphaera persica]|uniref:riboflavin biosynthesis protein RibF n=1 Tax=Fontisphaera persica TaxID=2974023 RepID=UPI0024BF1C3E|nr:riboflavin biosynthesis protein RibF [Fontisphaera persica]WCJ58740.1 riboflavin biosynthesis protein RibF [Fontisphaera persica]